MKKYKTLFYGSVGVAQLEVDHRELNDERPSRGPRGTCQTTGRCTTGPRSTVRTVTAST